VSVLSIGSCTITASQSGSTQYAPASLTKTIQIIKSTPSVYFSWTNGPGGYFAGNPWNLTGVSSTGTTVTVTVSGECTISGTAITITGTGTCYISGNSPETAFSKAGFQSMAVPVYATRQTP